MPSPALELMVGAHEERLQHMEQQMPELRSDVSTVSLQVKHLGETVLERLGDLQETMSAHAAASSKNTSQILERVGSLESARATVDKEALVATTKKETLWVWAKRLAIPISIAGTAALVKVGEAILDWLLKH